MAKFFSHAQFGEDVMIMRAIHHVHHENGFYIDVGANDPEKESVTKVFYDHGWHGVNIDASSAWVERLNAERHRDINIHAAISDKSGEITFYDQPDGGLGTTVESIAEMHRDEGVGRPLNATTVPALTLTQVCEQHAPSEIHFLKIDVEGGEGPVLYGMDFSRFRPWLMCIECHLPNHPEHQLYGEWEPYILSAGYTFVYTDTFNRFYISNDHSELFERFKQPMDDYARYADIREINELKAEREQLRQELARANNQLDELRRQAEERRKASAGLFGKMIGK